MADRNYSSEFLSRQISRRDILKKGAELAIGAGAVTLFGCSTDKAPLPSPQDKILTPTSTVPEAGRVPPFSEADIKRIANKSISDTNKVLGLGLSDSTQDNVRIVSNLQDYQQIVAVEEYPYTPKSELDRPALTTDGVRQKKEVVLFIPSIENVTKSLPASEIGKQAKQETFESIIDHELIHYSSVHYDSPEISDLLFNRMLANIPSLKGKEIKPLGVTGAKVYAEVEGHTISYFQNLEEAEAITISDYVFANRPSKNQYSILRPEYPGLNIQLMLLKELLTKTNPNIASGIKNLATLRTQEGGREKFCRGVGEFFKIPPDDQLFFGLSVLYTIDTGDIDTFRKLINR